MKTANQIAIFFIAIVNVYGEDLVITDQQLKELYPVIIETSVQELIGSVQIKSDEKKDFDAQKKISNWKPESDKKFIDDLKSLLGKTYNIEEIEELIQISKMKVFKKINIRKMEIQIITIKSIGLDAGYLRK